MSPMLRLQKDFLIEWLLHVPGKLSYFDFFTVGLITLWTKSTPNLKSFGALWNFDRYRKNRNFQTAGLGGKCHPKTFPPTWFSLPRRALAPLLLGSRWGNEEAGKGSVLQYCFAVLWIYFLAICWNHSPVVWKNTSSQVLTRVEVLHVIPWSQHL